MVFCYTHWSESCNWSLKCKLCSFRGREGFQMKLILFVSLGFCSCEILRWPWPTQTCKRKLSSQLRASLQSCNAALLNFGCGRGTLRQELHCRRWKKLAHFFLFLQTSIIRSVNLITLTSSTQSVGFPGAQVWYSLLDWATLHPGWVRNSCIQDCGARHLGTILLTVFVLCCTVLDKNLPPEEHNILSLCSCVIFAFCWIGWGPCALHHWIQSSMESILACHPAVSTEWLDWVANSRILQGRNRTHLWRVRNWHWAQNFWQNCSN